MATNSSREVHRKNPLTHRKGKQRLRPMSLKALYEIAEKEKSGRKFDAVSKEIARKIKKGVVYNAPKPVVEETTEEAQMESVIFYVLGLSMGVLVTLLYQKLTYKPEPKQYRKIDRVKFRTQSGTDEVSEIYGLFQVDNRAV